MKNGILRLFSRTMLVCLEILAVLTGLVFLICGILVWRLTSGPVDVGFAKDYIEQALYDPVSGYSVSLDSVVVSWPDLRGPLQLDLAGASIIKNNITILEIRSVSLGVAARYLLIGEIEPVSIILQQPALHLIRTAGNEIKFSLEDETRDIGNEPAEPDPLMRIIDMLSRPESEVDRRSPLSHLQSIKIKNAKMVVVDYMLGITWFMSPLDLSFSRDKAGLVISASAELPGGRDKISRLQADLVYLREKKEFLANIHVQDFDPHILSRKIKELEWLNDHYVILNGNIELGFGTDFHVHRAAVSLSSVNGALHLEDVYDAPLPFEQLYVTALYDEKQGLADLKELAIRSRGVTVSVSSKASIDNGAVKAPVTIRIPELPQARISPLWPDALRGEGAEIWLTQKLSKGRFQDIEVGFDVKAARKEDIWSIEVNNIVGDFLIEDMTIDYRAPLSPVAGADGKGRFEKDVLTIDIAQGAVGGLALKQGRVVLDNIIKGGGHARINTDLSGPLQDVLRYIAPEPIGMNEEELGLKVADVKGQADLNISVSFPTIRDLLAEQVVVRAEGTLRDVLLPDIVKTLDLSGGPLKLKVADGAAQISGKGKLDGRDISFEWKEFLNPDGQDFASRVSAELIADSHLRSRFGIGLDEWIEGTFPVKVVYTDYGDNRAQADVTANLRPGRVMVSPLDYSKPPGTQGTAMCKILFRNGYVTEVRDLNVTTDRLRLKGARFFFDIIKGNAELRRGAIPQFFLDENQLDIELETEPSGLLKMAVNGAFLDARPFLGHKKDKAPRDGPPLIVSLDVERMRTHPARMVDDVKAYLSMNRQGDVSRFEMDAVAGRGAIYLRLKPDERGIMTIRLEADDAGAAMRAFDMYENIKGGKLVIYGEAASVQDKNVLRGKAELTDFHVVNAPVLAQLVSAISLLGIQQLLGGEGIYFSRLESEFDWLIRREGDQYIVRNGRTSGSSLGLTFEGNIDKSIDRIAMEGTIVPVSMVNEMIGAIPLIGDILTGGGGGIIAATYEVEGPIKEPDVSVNPLSALAPGILRTILFE